MPAHATFPENTPDSADKSIKTRQSDATLWQQFSLPYRFPVVFTQDLFHTENRVFVDTLAMREAEKRHRLVVFIDNGVVKALPGLPMAITRYCQTHAAQLDLVQPPVLVAGGEAIKSGWQYLESLHEILHAQQLDRHSYIVAIGGGAVLDAVGLVAATAHRGIRHVRVPTTVLAQNDSGVGVKNGINRFDQKNWLGTFAPPFAVLNDSGFLAVLSDREKRAGMAEAVKVALIRDAQFFQQLEQSAEALRVFEPAALEHLIRRCAELHMRQIGQGGDPFELGSARPLDFGHWAAHRLETLTGHKLRHGEAVAIGMTLDIRFSVLSGLLHEDDEQRIRQLLKTIGFRLWDDALERLDRQGNRAVMSGLADFQAHLGGELTITLLEGIGKGIEVHEMDHALINTAIDQLRNMVA